MAGVGEEHTERDRVNRETVAGTVDLVPGARVADRYRVLRHLGSGGSSLVAACTDERTGAEVAVKLLRTPHPKDAERLLREARILSGLTSDHITRLVDFGTLDTGEPYLVTELVAGQDLAAVLRQRGRFPIHEGCDIVLQACAGLEEAHAKGIVHRDIKPGNMILTRRPDGSNLVKLLDFGISRSASLKAEEGTLTETNDLLGTPHYMAPEQIKNARLADARADIFSLGALLYRLLTGCYPFDGETAAEVIINIASMPAPSLLVDRPEAPAGLDAVIRKCLAKSVEGRIQTVTDLRKHIAAALDEIEDAVDTVPRGASDAEPAQATAAVAPPTPRAWTAPAAPTVSLTPPASAANLPAPAIPAPSRSRSRGVLVMLAAALVVLGGGAVVLRTTRAGPGTTATATAAASPSASTIATTAPPAPPASTIATAVADPASTAEPSPVPSSSAGAASAATAPTPTAASSGRRGQPKRPPTRATSSSAEKNVDFSLRQ